MRWRPRLSQAFAAVVLAAFMPSAGMAAETPLNLLFFGNSFSQGGAVPTKVGQLAVADGHVAPLILADLQSGQDLAYHIGQIDTAPQNNVNHPSIAVETWDFVIQQGYSTESTHLGDPAGFRADAVTLHQRVAGHASGRGAGVTSVLYETWARGPGHSFYPSSFTSPAAMQAEVRDSYLGALSDILASEGPGSARVAPVGDAFEARGFALALYGGDIYHASTAGSLLASMVLYRTIYQEDLSDVGYASVSGWAGVNQSTWNSLVATADAMALPEPASVALLGAAGVALLARRR